MTKFICINNLLSNLIQIVLKT